jgi:hypothetical protein
MGDIATWVAMCSGSFLVGVLAWVWLCRKALKSGASIEGGIKVLSSAFWLRMTPPSREASPGSEPIIERAWSNDPAGADFEPPGAEQNDFVRGANAPASSGQPPHLKMID